MEIEVHDELTLTQDPDDLGLWYLQTPDRWIPIADNEIDALIEALQKAKAISACGEGEGDEANR